MTLIQDLNDSLRHLSYMRYAKRLTKKIQLILSPWFFFLPSKDISIVYFEALDNILDINYSRSLAPNLFSEFLIFLEFATRRSE